MEEKLKKAGGLVSVSGHTRSLPTGKKEIVLSEKAKAEIGGIVKNCAFAALKEKMFEIIMTAEQSSFPREVSDCDLIRTIYGWYAGHHRNVVEKFQILHQENEELKKRLANVKKAIN